jgi:hypothetical protein
MKPARLLKSACVAALVAALLGCATAPPSQDATGPAVQIQEGHLFSGAAFRFERPARWNGTLLVYSRGYTTQPGVVRVASGNEKDALLSRGYALIGVQPAKSGWAVEDVVPDQLAAMDRFAMRHGEPKRTIAIGSSMGALVTTALIEQHGARFDGALAMCGSIGGTLAMMNQAFDGTWAFSTLNPGAKLPVRINGSGDAARAQRAAWAAAVESARTTALGRARLALAAAVSQAAAWADGQATPPAADDTDGQADALARALLPAVLLPRDDQEARAGGNYSWNDGVDYAAQVRASGREPLLRALYRKAGADLDADLATLAAAPRIAADPAAVAYMHAHYVPSARPSKPVLTLQTSADPLTLTEFGAAYARAAAAAGAGAQVRTVHVRRLRHCGFEPAEVIAALQTLEARIAGGAWATEAAALNALVLRATPPDAAANTRAPFVEHQPLPLLRPCWNNSSSGCPGLSEAARKAIAAPPAPAARAPSPAWLPNSTPLGSGAFPALMESVAALPQHTVYRPANLAALGSRRLPVVAWANGACLNVGNRFRWFLTELASHGYLVVAIGPIGPPEVESGGTLSRNARGRPAPDSPAALGGGAPGLAESSPAQLRQAIDWAVAENGRAGSALAGRIATDRIAVMGQSCGGLQALAAGGDARVRTVGIWNSGMLADEAMASRIAGAPLSKQVLRTIRVPMLYVSGDPGDVAFPNADDDFARIDHVPVLRAWRARTPHAGTYRESGGGAYAPVAIAWLRWMLEGDAVAAKTFSGADCGLCREADWHVRRKRLPQQEPQ